MLEDEEVVEAKVAKVVLLDWVVPAIRISVLIGTIVVDVTANSS